MVMNMDSILRANLKESSSEIKAAFNKTINIRQYESEVIQSDAKLHIEGNMTGAERMLLEAITRAQIEYGVYVSLLCKKQITDIEFANRKEALEKELATIKAKTESILGRSVDNLFE